MNSTIVSRLHIDTKLGGTHESECVLNPKLSIVSAFYKVGQVPISY